MATGPGSTDAENGVKMAARDRFHPGAAAAPRPRRRPRSPARRRPRSPARRRPRRRPRSPPRSPGTETAAEPAAETAAETAAEPAAETGTETAASASQQGPGLQVYGDSAYGSGGGPRRLPRRRARHGDRSPGRCARRCPAGSPWTTSPSTRTTTRSPARPHHPPDERHPDGDLRRGVRGLPAAPAVHHRPGTGRSMTIHPHEGLLRRAARAQARTAEFKQAYPTRSAIERTIAWTATQNGRRVKHASLPRHRQEQRLAAQPVRRAEPADAAEGRAGPTGRGLGSGLTGQAPAGAPARGPGGPRAGPAGATGPRCRRGRPREPRHWPAPRPDGRPEGTRGSGLFSGLLEVARIGLRQVLRHAFVLGTPALTRSSMFCTKRSLGSVPASRWLGTCAALAPAPAPVPASAPAVGPCGTPGGPRRLSS